ncbi:MAG: hypothetical protein V5A64_03985 [Candidatus Thermoplasmatota archaeon]
MKEKKERKEKQAAKYLKEDSLLAKKIVKTELLFAPILLALPLITGFYFIYDWYARDFVLNQIDLTIELLLGCIVLFGNFLFYIPFIKSLKGFHRKK